MTLRDGPFSSFSEQVVQELDVLVSEIGLMYLFVIELYLSAGSFLYLMLTVSFVGFVFLGYC